MSNDSITEIWVLKAKVDAYEKALVESQAATESAKNDSRVLAADFHRLRDGVRGMAHTLRSWAVSAGGHTPSAIVASRLLQLIGDEKEPPDIDLAKDPR